MNVFLFRAMEQIFSLVFIRWKLMFRIQTPGLSLLLDIR